MASRDEIIRYTVFLNVSSPNPVGKPQCGADNINTSTTIIMEDSIEGENAQASFADERSMEDFQEDNSSGKLEATRKS
jgi:hypothetical protein